MFYFFVSHSKVELALVERKRRLVALKVDECERYSNIDLTLKLALPTKNSDNLENASKFSPPLPSYLSSILSSDLGGTAKDELPSMVVMGCTNCLKHVMVIKTDPKCPMCKNRVLVVANFRGNPAKRIRKIAKFRGNPAKRIRKSQI
jgi:DNA-directed RNA polymerase subunit RPC12/RpoP